MAILYIGPHRNPDFATDYYISPILAPAHLLAQFPPLLMQCGEKVMFGDIKFECIPDVRKPRIHLSMIQSSSPAVFEKPNVLAEMSWMHYFSIRTLALAKVSA